MVPRAARFRPGRERDDPRPRAAGRPLEPCRGGRRRAGCPGGLGAGTAPSRGVAEGLPHPSASTAEGVRTASPDRRPRGSLLNDAVLDASALVSLCVDEGDVGTFRKLARAGLVTWSVSAVEIASAIERRRREG